MMSRHWLTPAHQLWARATHVSWCNQFDNSLPRTKGVIIKRRKGPLSQWIGGVLWGMWEMCISHHYHRPRADCPFHPTQPDQVVSKQSIKIISISQYTSCKCCFASIFIVKCDDNIEQLKQTPAWSIDLSVSAWVTVITGPGLPRCECFPAPCLSLSPCLATNQPEPLFCSPCNYRHTLFHRYMTPCAGSVSGIFLRWLKLPEAGILGYVGRLVTLGSGRIIQKISRNN